MVNPMMFRINFSNLSFSGAMGLPLLGVSSSMQKGQVVMWSSTSRPQCGQAVRCLFNRFSAIQYYLNHTWVQKITKSMMPAESTLKMVSAARRAPHIA